MDILEETAEKKVNYCHICKKTIEIHFKKEGVDDQEKHNQIDR